MTTLILSVFFSISALAYDVEVNGIFYDISGTTATVTSGEKEYSGMIVIPESITFENSIYSVTSIGDDAFAYCENIENVYCYAEEVPSTDYYAFYDSNIENATLYVPASAIEAYKTTEPWSDFGTIKAIEDSNGIESAKERGIAIQSAGGFINISGLDNNETVSFYALDGKALGTAKSIDGNVSFSAKQGTIVVARIGKESVKIAVK